MIQSQISYDIFIVNRGDPYSQGAQEISFKLHSFETPQRLMGQWTNSNIHCTVTDGPICQSIRLILKIKIHTGLVAGGTSALLYI